MKKIISIVIALMLMSSLMIACKGNNTDNGGKSTEAPVVTAEEQTPEPTAIPTPEPKPVWVTPDKLNDESVALFEKAFEDFVGVNYTPLAYLGVRESSKETIHCFFCEATVVYPDEVPYFTIVMISEMNGEYAIRSINNLNISATSTVSPWMVATSQGADLMQGWVAPENVAPTDEDAAYITKALDGFEGSTYEAEAHVADYHDDNGSMKCYLCRTFVVGQEESTLHYILLYIAEDAEGALKINKVSQVALDVLLGEE